MLLSTESPLKIIKNACYFMLKAIFVLEIITFFPGFLIGKKKGFIRKPSSIPKFMLSQTGQQIIRIHILLDVSRCKGNHSNKLVS